MRILSKKIAAALSAAALVAGSVVPSFASATAWAEEPVIETVLDGDEIGEEDEDEGLVEGEQEAQEEKQEYGQEQGREEEGFDGEEGGELVEPAAIALYSDEIDEPTVWEPEQPGTIIGYAGSWPIYEGGICFVPDGVASISAGPFTNNKQIKTVYIPQTVTVISANAFQSSSLESIVIPETVRMIGAGAFSNSSIKSITFDIEQQPPATFQGSAFTGCNLEELVFRADANAYASLPSKIKTAWTSGPFVNSGLTNVGQISAVINNQAGMSDEEVDLLRYNFATALASTAGIRTSASGYLTMPATQTLVSSPLWSKVTGVPDGFTSGFVARFVNNELYSIYKGITPDITWSYNGWSLEDSDEGQHIKLNMRPTSGSVTFYPLDENGDKLVLDPYEVMQSYNEGDGFWNAYLIALETGDCSGLLPYAPARYGYQAVSVEMKDGSYTDIFVRYEPAKVWRSITCTPRIVNLDDPPFMGIFDFPMSFEVLGPDGLPTKQEVAEHVLSILPEGYHLKSDAASSVVFTERTDKDTGEKSVSASVAVVYDAPDVVYERVCYNCGRPTNDAPAGDEAAAFAVCGDCYGVLTDMAHWEDYGSVLAAYKASGLGYEDPRFVPVAYEAEDGSLIPAPWLAPYLNGGSWTIAELIDQWNDMDSKARPFVYNKAKNSDDETIFEPLSNSTDLPDGMKTVYGLVVDKANMENKGTELAMGSMSTALVPFNFLSVSWSKDGYMPLEPTPMPEEVVVPPTPDKTPEKPNMPANDPKPDPVPAASYEPYEPIDEETLIDEYDNMPNPKEPLAQTGDDMPIIPVVLLAASAAVAACAARRFS